jgi:CTP:molybdopterin cytidylyltransferase MocA
MSQAVPILILAAGASSRMGDDDKLLQLVDGQDLLSLVVGRAVATGGPVYVTLATDRMKLARAIADQPVTIVPVAEAARGVSESLKAGIRSLPKGAQGVLIMLADMPELTTDDICLMLTHFAELGSMRVVRATDKNGTPGHPVILPARLFPKVEKLHGDIGARDLIQGEMTNEVPLPGLRATTDLDTPEDWIAWRAKRRK